MAAIGLISYEFLPQWAVYWSSKTGKQKTASCIFGIPFKYGEVTETALSKRIGKVYSEDEEWIRVASARPADRHILISWCFTEVEFAFVHLENSLNRATLQSFEWGDPIDHGNFIPAFTQSYIEALAEKHGICRLNSILRNYSEELRIRDIESNPLSSVEIMNLFSTRSTTRTR